MATGTAVNTGDVITAAKLNLKQEDGTALANLGVLDQSGVGTEDLRLVCSENLTANRNLTFTVNDAARTIDLGGNLTLAAAFITSGANSLTLTTTGATNVTLPTTGTLATLAGAETLTNKTITAATLSGTFPGTPTFSGATLTFTGTAIALTGGAAFSLGTTDAFALNLRAGGANRLGISNTIGQFTIYQTTANYTLSFSDPGAARTVTFGDPGGADNIAYLAATQTFTNKTYSGGTLSGTLAGTPTLSGATITLTGGTLNLTGGAAYTLGTTDNFALVMKANNANRFAVSNTIGTLTVYQATGNYTLSFSDPAAGRTVTFPDPGGADSVVYLAATQTITGKTLTLAGTPLNFTAGAGFVVGTTDNFAVTVKTNAVNKFAFTTTLGQFTVMQTTANYTLAFSDPGAARTITFPDPGGADSVVYLAATQTITGKTLTLSGSPLNFTAGAGFVLGTTDNQTLTIKTNAVNKFIFTATLGQFQVLQTTANWTLAFSDPGAARTLTFADPGGADNVAYLSATQTLTGKTISLSGDLTFASALDIEVQTNTAATLQVNAGGATFLNIDSRTGTDGAIAFTWDLADPTFVSAAGSAFNMHRINAFTVNLTGGVGVTAMNGVAMEFQAPTLAADGATTVTTASTLYLRPLTAGANMTITNSRMIDTSVAGCFLTAAGVWTDASSLAHKLVVKTVDTRRIPKLLDELRVVSYKRKDPADGGYERFGVIAEEAPDFLADSQHQGIAPQYMAGFALAAVKWLKKENEQLQKRIAQLETRLGVR